MLVGKILPFPGPRPLRQRRPQISSSSLALFVCGRAEADDAKLLKLSFVIACKYHLIFGQLDGGASAESCCNEGRSSCDVALYKDFLLPAERLQRSFTQMQHLTILLHNISKPEAEP